MRPAGQLGNLGHVGRRAKRIACLDDGLAEARFPIRQGRRETKAFPICIHHDTAQLARGAERVANQSAVDDNCHADPAATVTPTAGCTQRLHPNSIRPAQPIRIVIQANGQPELARQMIAQVEPSRQRTLP